MSKYSKEEMISMWPQAAGELNSFAQTLRRSNAGLTAAQIEMAIQMANAYLDSLKTKEGVFVHQCPSPPKS